MPWPFWVGLAVVALMGEMLTSRLYLAPVSIAALGAAGLSLALPAPLQVAAFCVFSLVLLGGVRPAVLRLLPAPETGQEPPKIGPAGQRASAVQPIDHRGGEICVGRGEYWSARCCEPGVSIKPGQEVEILRLEGLTAVVRPAVATVPFHLTRREMEVLQLLADYSTNQEIAGRLGLRPSTVQHHVGRILAKLGARNRDEAVALARDHGLISTAASPPTMEQRSADGAEMQAFLFADVRGYTHFTRAHGDEAAAQLVARFTTLVRKEVGQYAGRVLELRGDEVLAAFSSVRQGLRAAVAIQACLAEEASAGRGSPIPVGIGLDVGEAVPIGDGYRGGALNLASRLCSAAAAGEVLATSEAVHLAGQMAELRYMNREPLNLKGFDEPMQVYRVVASDDREPTRTEVHS